MGIDHFGRKVSFPQCHRFFYLAEATSSTSSSSCWSRASQVVRPASIAPLPLSHASRLATRLGPRSHVLRFKLVQMDEMLPLEPCKMLCCALGTKAFSDFGWRVHALMHGVRRIGSLERDLLVAVYTYCTYMYTYTCVYIYIHIYIYVGSALFKISNKLQGGQRGSTSRAIGAQSWAYSTFFLSRQFLVLVWNCIGLVFRFRFFWYWFGFRFFCIGLGF